MSRSLLTVSVILLMGSVASAQYGVKSTTVALATPATSALSASTRSSVPANGHDAVAINGLASFTHTSEIPESADLASIRFESVRAVRIPTRTYSTTDADYCEAASLRDPGGSIECPAVHRGAFTRAYQVTYSFEGPALASDEYGSRRNTFSVYFRPEEFSPEQRTAVRQGGRAHLAEFFELTTSRELQSREVVDYNNSAFCDGTYVDGLWVHTSPGCQDSIRFKTITTSSGRVTARVEPAPVSRGMATASIN